MRKLFVRFLTTAGVALVAAVAALLPTAVASADNGDNGPGCASGEICFWYNSRDTLQKQFWYDADHGGIFFMYYDGYRYERSDEPLQDNALEATNRDTECSVRVGNYSGGLWTWRTLPNDRSRYYLGVVNNRNDRHERCR